MKIGAGLGLSMFSLLQLACADDLPPLHMHIFAKRPATPDAASAHSIGTGNTPHLHMAVLSGRSASIPLRTPARGRNLTVTGERVTAMALQTDIHKTTGYAAAAPAAGRLLYDFSTGYQRERMSWNVAAPGGSPNPLTGVRWHDLELWGIRGLVDIVSPSGLAIKGEAGFAWSYAGQGQENTYARDGGRNPVSQINSKSDSGYAYEASLGLGYQWLFGNPQASALWFGATPLAGYAWRQQQRVLRSSQASAGGAVAGKNLYTATWHGPWLGLDLNFGFAGQHELFGSFAHHWVVGYRGDGQWQQAPNLLQPDSFSHRSEGSGYVASAGYRFHTRDLWGFSVRFDYQHWQADSGDETLYFAGGGNVHSVLNEVKRDVFGINLGLNVAF